MDNLCKEAEQIMIERFGRDTIIALATTEKLKKVFAEWINNGHTDFDDENTIILRVELTDGLLFSHDTRYEF